MCAITTFSAGLGALSGLNPIIHANEGESIASLFLECNQTCLMRLVPSLIALPAASSPLTWIPTVWTDTSACQGLFRARP
jgi:hypothetical protein